MCENKHNKRGVVDDELTSDAIGSQFIVHAHGTTHHLHNLTIRIFDTKHTVIYEYVRIDTNKVNMIARDEYRFARVRCEHEAFSACTPTVYTHVTD